MIANNYITPFLEYILLEKGYSRHTITAYKTDLIAFKDFCEVVYDQDSLVSVNYVQVRSWVVSLIDAGISNNTVNRKVSSLKSFYKFLQKTGLIEINPLAKHKALKVPKKVHRGREQTTVGYTVVYCPGQPGKELNVLKQ